MKPLLIDRFLPTTQTCSPCGHREHLFLLDRAFNCVACGSEIDRDINSAINMILFGEETPKTFLPEDFWEVMPAEGKVSMQILKSNPHIYVSYASLTQEDLSSN